MDTTLQESAPQFFASRRLAHANVFVSDYMAASDFYQRVFGFAEAYRQPDNLASFMSNGNTYHDFALVDIKSKYARKGQRPGLNHLAFETSSEGELVRSYQRARAAGIEFLFTANHDVAYSIYMRDPDGNEVEFYADVVEDWVEARKGIIIKKKPEWIPGETNVPDERHLYHANPSMLRREDALAQGKRVTHMAIAARDFDGMYAFYTSVAGLHAVVGDAQSDCVLLAGSASTGDLALIRAQDDAHAPMHHIGVEVWSEQDLDAAARGIEACGGRVLREVDHASRRALSVADSDGLVLQLYVNRDWRPEVIRTASAHDLPWLV
ncbi:VOC family protein [Paraburkholderia sp. SIMBA_009]